MGKKVIISVISDLVTDQRVRRTALTFSRQGFEVCLVGRRLKHSRELETLPYATVRFVLPFEKGPFFYLVYNLRLFFFLLFRKADLLVANDLDTLLPNFFVSRLRGIRLLYDSHEYFTGVPELESRPSVQKIWKLAERLVFPHLSYIITVNESIASLYRNEYHKQVRVVRNIPDWPGLPAGFDKAAFRREQGLPSGKKIIILQGSGINVDRGGEEAVAAMEYLEDAVLLVAGSGDVIGRLKEQCIQKHLGDKVLFRDKMPYEELLKFTCSADIGLTLDKDTNINYRYSLPNKLFDYIHAGIAVLASDLVEVKKIIMKYEIGQVVEGHDPLLLSEKLNDMLKNRQQLEKYKSNALKAAAELTWQQEQKQLLAIIDELFR